MPLDGAERHRLTFQRIGPQSLVQNQRARVLLVRAGPLQPTMLIKPGIAHPLVHLGKAAQLVPSVLAGQLRPVVPHPPGKVGDDLQVLPCLTGRVQSLAAALHPSLGVGDGAFGLAPVRSRGQHHIGQLCGRGQHDVLYDEDVEVAEHLAGVGDVGLGLGRVLPHDVERADVSPAHRFEHLRQMQALLGRKRHSPSLLETQPILLGLDVTEARVLVRDGAHVAPALDVVLPPERVQAGAGLADVAGQQREVDQGQDVVHAGDMLGDPQRPADLGPLRVAIGMG